MCPDTCNTGNCSLLKYRFLIKPGSIATLDQIVTTCIMPVPYLSLFRERQCVALRNAKPLQSGAGEIEGEERLRCCSRPTSGNGFSVNEPMD